MTRIGVVATNQERKDIGLAMEVCAKLAAEHDLLLWLHTDTMKRAWDIDALLHDFKLTEIAEVTLAPMSEPEMVQRYRACHLTLAPGSGEGFGYPIWESLACGVPCVHGAYASGASLMATCGLEHLLVHPMAWRLEGQHNARRPVYDSDDWVQTIVQVMAMKEDWRARVAHLDWPALRPRFMKWFDQGIEVVQI